MHCVLQLRLSMGAVDMRLRGYYLCADLACLALLLAARLAFKVPALAAASNEELQEHMNTLATVRKPHYAIGLSSEVVP